MPKLSTSDFQTHGLSSNHGAGAVSFLGRFHRHNEIELNYLCRGRFVYSLGGRNIPLPLRSLSVFWAGFSHMCVEQAPDSEIRALSLPLDIFLSWGLPHEMFVHPLLNGELLHESDPALADADEAAMRRWHDDLNATVPARREALLLEVHARLLRLAFNAGAVQARRDADPCCVAKMLQHIAAHYRDPELSVPDIARHAGIHPNYAAAVFKKTCGVCLMHYVTHQRIAHAQRLLAITSAKILDIAMDAGFGSVSQFHHVFRTVIGVTPREYAKARENK